MRRPASAFTLIEVLVALAIFVMMAVVLGSAYINVLSAYEMAGRVGVRNEDVRFARELLLREAEREAAERGAEFDGGDGRRVRWSATIEPTSLPDLFLVNFSCEIAATNAEKAETVTERFQLLRPTWSEPEARGRLKGETKQRIQKIVQTLQQQK